MYFDHVIDICDTFQYTHCAWRPTSGAPRQSMAITGFCRRSAHDNMARMRRSQLICAASGRGKEARSLPVCRRHVCAVLQCGLCKPHLYLSDTKCHPVFPGVGNLLRRHTVSTSCYSHPSTAQSPVCICLHASLVPEAPMNSSVRVLLLIGRLGCATVVPLFLVWKSHCPRIALANKGLSKLVPTLSVLVATLSQTKSKGCLVLFPLRKPKINALSASLTCGKPKQTVYYAKTYL